jgi:hypothetical protein
MSDIISKQPAQLLSGHALFGASPDWAGINKSRADASRRPSLRLHLSLLQLSPFAASLRRPSSLVDPRVATLIKKTTSPGPPRDQGIAHRSPHPSVPTSTPLPRLLHLPRGCPSLHFSRFHPLRLRRARSSLLRNCQGRVPSGPCTVSSRRSFHLPLLRLRVALS